MQRSYIFCHMMTSLDGKIMGPYMETPKGVAASADGSADTPALFTAKEGLSENHPVNFTLQEMKAMDRGSIWLRYTIKNNEGRN